MPKARKLIIMRNVTSVKKINVEFNAVK